MSWMRTDWDFGDSYACFTVGERDLFCWMRVRCVVNVNAEDPEKMAYLLRELVTAWRPNLKGCQVVSIRLGGFLTWEICVMHPSLPRVKPDDRPEPVRLKTCESCKGDFGPLELANLVMHEGRQVEVCSKCMVGSCSRCKKPLQVAWHDFILGGEKVRLCRTCHDELMVPNRLTSSVGFEMAWNDMLDEIATDLDGPRSKTLDEQANNVAYDPKVYQSLVDEMKASQPESYLSEFRCEDASDGKPSAFLRDMAKVNESLKRKD